MVAVVGSCACPAGRAGGLTPRLEEGSAVGGAGTEDGRALAAGQPQASRPGVFISSTCRRTVPSSAAATGRSAGWRGRRVSRAGRARKTGGPWRQGRFPANGQYWVRGDNFPPGQEPARGYGILCGTADDLEPAGVQER